MTIAQSFRAAATHARALAVPVLVAVMLTPTSATAQLALPVTAAQQQRQQQVNDNSFGTAGAGQQVPPAQVSPFEPADLETYPPYQPQVQTSDPAAAEETKLVGSSSASEFESFVSTIVGKPLRRFGSELLVPDTRGFAAPPTATIPPDYKLNPGDQIRLALAGSVQATNLRLTIDNEGRIFVPKVGPVTVGGVRYGDLREVVANAISRQYRSFEIDAAVARLKGVTVFVTGFAQYPGSFSVGSLSTLVNAVLAAGGPSAGGSFRSIQLRRGGRLVSDFDLYDLLLKGDRSGDAVLQNGDVIYIAPAGEEVAVVGSVNNEAIFELAPGETLADALVYAGGANTLADRSRVMVLDSLGAADAGWQEMSATRARATPARRGDVIRVLTDAGLARPLQQQSLLVTISGEVARPGRYFFKPGTSLADVLAQAGGLTTAAFPYASVITRESVKRQQRASFDRAIDDVEMQLTAQPLTSVNREQLIQPSEMAMIRSVIDQMRKREPTGRLVFDLPADAATLPEHLIMENNDTIYVPPRPVTVGVFGAVPTPASFAYGGNQQIGDFIKLAGGIQNLGDKSEIFVVRANGTVLAQGRRTLHAKALPGDLIYVPVDGNRGEFWARMRDITGTLFGGLVGAASIKALAQ